MGRRYSGHRLEVVHRGRKGPDLTRVDTLGEDEMRRSFLFLALFLAACTPAVPPGGGETGPAPGGGTGPAPGGGGTGPAPSVDVAATRDAYVATEDPFGEVVTKVVYLDQGWSPSRSLEFYFTTQG